MAIRVHELKITKEYADSVHSGDKTFEVRLNDRGFQKGDIVRFKPLSKSGASVDTRHPLYDKEYEITYVLGSFCGLAQGYVAFGIKPMPEEPDGYCHHGREVDCNGCKYHSYEVDACLKIGECEYEKVTESEGE